MTKDLFANDLVAITKRLPMWNIELEIKFSEHYLAANYYDWVDQVFPRCTVDFPEETKLRLQNIVRLFIETPNSGITLEGELHRIMAKDVRASYVNCLIDLGVTTDEAYLSQNLGARYSDERGTWYADDYNEMSLVLAHYNAQNSCRPGI